MACLFVPFPMILDDLEGHSPDAGLIKYNSTNIVRHLARFNCHGASRCPSAIAELLVLCSFFSFPLYYVVWLRALE